MYELFLIFGLFFVLRGAVMAAAAIFHECSRFGAGNIGRKHSYGEEDDGLNLQTENTAFIIRQGV